MAAVIPDSSSSVDASLPSPTLSIAEAIRASVRSDPDAIALTTPSHRYTYDEIDRWSDRIASSVIAANAPIDRPVAIITRDNVALVPAVLGVVKAGHYFITIDGTDPADRIEFLLAESGAGLCMAEDRADVGRVAGLPPFLPLDSCPAAGEEVRPPTGRTPHQHVFVTFTSGTTGKPKAVMTEQDGYVRKSVMSSMRQDLGRGDRTSFTALPGFLRSANGAFAAFLRGATLCSFDARSGNLNELADFIRRERVTVLHVPPALFRRLIAAASSSLDFSSVRLLRLGADRITIADVEAFKKHFPRGCILRHGFASTETGGGVMSMAIDHDTRIEGPLVPMGKPRPGVEVRLVDEEGNDVPDGETGEMIVTSETVVTGYWNDAALSAEKFSASNDGRRTVRTGDLARRDANGLYYFVGRRDARLKINSRRIDPSEVEGALLAGGDLRDAVILAKGEPGRQKLMAYVVMADGRPFNPRALRTRLRATMPPWMVPARILEIDAIPMTRAGKVDRRALIDRVDPEEPERASGAQDDLERQLVAIWTRATEQPVHVDDDFFDDLGGDSIVAAHLSAAVEQATGKKLALSLLLELNTVRRMAEYLRASVPSDHLAVAVQATGSHPPVFCVCGGGGSVMVFRALAEQLGPDQPFYGLQHHGFERGAFPRSFEAMAACFVDAIRGVQPSGPYFLAGYSMGGQIAYQIARHFERIGERVAFVGLMDTSASRVRAPFMTRLAQRFEMLWRQPLDRGRAYVAEAAHLPGRLLREAREKSGREMPESLHEAGARYTKARRGFTLRPYGGAVTLFAARGGMQRLSRERDLGWSRIKVGRFDLVEISGDHNSMLTRDVAGLGRAFRTALAAARNDV